MTGLFSLTDHFHYVYNLLKKKLQGVGVPFKICLTALNPADVAFLYAEESASDMLDPLTITRPPHEVMVVLCW